MYIREQPTRSVYSIDRHGYARTILAGRSKICGRVLKKKINSTRMDRQNNRVERARTTLGNSKRARNTWLACLSVCNFLIFLVASDASLVRLFLISRNVGNTFLDHHGFITMFIIISFFFFFYFSSNTRRNFASSSSSTVATIALTTQIVFHYTHLPILI